MKACKLHCAFQHEGFCTVKHQKKCEDACWAEWKESINAKECQAKTEDDLVEDEELLEG